MERRQVVSMQKGWRERESERLRVREWRRGWTFLLCFHLLKNLWSLRRHGGSVMRLEVNTPDPLRPVTFRYPLPISATFCLPSITPSPDLPPPDCSSPSQHTHYCGSPVALLPPPLLPRLPPPPSPPSSLGQERPGRAMCFQSGLDGKSKQGFCVYQATAPSPCSNSRLEAPANWWQQQQPCSTHAPFFSMHTHTHTHSTLACLVLLLVSGEEVEVGVLSMFTSHTRTHTHSHTVISNPADTLANKTCEPPWQNSETCQSPSHLMPRPSPGSNPTGFLYAHRATIDCTVIYWTWVYWILLLLQVNILAYFYYSGSAAIISMKCWIEKIKSWSNILVIEIDLFRFSLTLSLHLVVSICTITHSIGAVMCL